MRRSIPQEKTMTENNSRWFYGFTMGMLIGVGLTFPVMAQKLKNKNAEIEDLKRDASNLDDQIELLEANLKLRDTMVAFYRQNVAKAQVGSAAWQEALKTENANLSHCAELLNQSATAPQ
jgi:uncharacterized protein YdcH (DUF465 family)